ncbi:pectin acetylesterase 8 [Capsicum annuum]|uniref:pectin acetylesterase 8 n=1 Tax=Capsicum annuum TaxID=4072 RepID=UPI001FB04C1D|nr:pectin acetylesterase 8 [Capsicum annuum]
MLKFIHGFKHLLQHIYFKKMMMASRSLQLFILFVCSLTIITIECSEVEKQNPNLYNITKTVVHSAVSKGAVCLDGSPPAYYFDPGFGDGVDSWIVQISGGAWCVNVTDCIGRTKTQLGSSKYMGEQEFRGIHSKNKSANPDFYNWNKVILAYCDGGSFVGDVEYVDPATNLHFRGKRIFYAILEELLEKGLKNAKNALLAGGSAGGYPAVLYCDSFRDSLPSAARVKCLNDCGYFPHFKNSELEKNWHVRFSGVAELQGAAQSLPKSCTSKMKPELCLYSQNIQQDIKTPLFIFMSAYDNVETKYTFGDYMGGLIDGGKCSASQNQSLIEMRSEFLNALPKGDNPKLRGVFVDSVHHHNSLLRRWIPETAINVNGQLHTEVFADWYFDRKYTYLIDETNELPLTNNARLIWSWKVDNATYNATARVIYNTTL